MSQSSSRIWAYFYDQKDDIDIHQPSLRPCCSRKGLKNVRLIALLLMTVIYFWQVAISKSFFIEIEFFTLHGVFLAWLYFSLITFDSIFNDSEASKKAIISNGLKYWIGLIYECAICFQVPITLIYWLLLFKHDLKKLKTPYVVLFALQHSFPIVLLMLDFIYNRYMFKLARIIPILVYGILYLVINIGYTLSARPVYPIMKWNDAGSVIYALTTCVLIVLTFLVLRLITFSFKAKEQHVDHYVLEEERDR